MNQITERKVKIKLYEEEAEITVSPDLSILQAAMEAGLDPPFSCQLGACATCKAKLKSGKILMDEHDALTDEEIQEGWVLTCQSHPLTDNVYIDYDDDE
jgi:ring-1,2-phenylacetyl-CoA epoxidase subunit PaaE